MAARMEEASRFLWRLLVAEAYDYDGGSRGGGPTILLRLRVAEA